jgi:hypothetical protein
LDLRFSPGLPGFDCIGLEVEIGNRRYEIANVHSVISVRAVVNDFRFETFEAPGYVTKEP